MRETARALVLAVLALIGGVVLGVASALTAAVTLAATALIVPGTGTPNANIVENYMQNARDRYMTTTQCTDASCTLIGIDYPASFWPLGFPPFPSSWCPGLTCKTWNESEGEGVDHLDAAVQPLLPTVSPTNQVVIFGYSQGGAVVSQEMYNLADLPQSTKDNIVVVTIGNIENPQGLLSRLSFLPTIPILNITFGPVLPTDIGIKSINYVFEYDAVGDAPLYWGNPLAVLNAIAALEYVHGNYLLPNGNDENGSLPYGYTPGPDGTLAQAIQDPDNIRTYQDATFVLIPQQGTLPIMQPIVDLAAATGTTPLVKPFVDLISPTLKVLIDLGYDRTANPGIPRTLSILPFDPFQNWVQVGVNLVAAAGEGVQAFLGDLGATTTIAPTAPAPTTVSTLAVSEPVSDPVVSPPAPALKLVHANETAAQNVDVVEEKSSTGDATEVRNETTPSTPNDPPVTQPEETTKPDVATTTDRTTKTDETKDADAEKKADDSKKADDPKKPETKPDVSKKPDRDTGDTDHQAAA